MITETGKNLSVLIVTETGQDWQTFATWYSVFKNLPDAAISIICHRNGDTPFEYFQWIKRLKIDSIRRLKFVSGQNPANTLSAVKMAYEHKMVGENLLVIKPLVMALAILDQKFLGLLNNAYLEKDVWFLQKPNINKMMDDYLLEDKLEIRENRLCFEAKETLNSVCLTSYQKGCGKWINTSIGCPFSSAAGLVSTEMTINETRIIELWQKMVPLYQALT